MMQKIENSNICKSDSELSLSPESGSLFHLYHSKVVKNEASVCSSISDTKISHNSYEKTYKTKKNFHNKKQPSHHDYHIINRMDKFPSLTLTDHLAANDEAEKHCNKTFHLKDSSDQSHKQWKLPTLNTFYTQKLWKIPELLKMKDDLNSVKSQLESFDIDLWHRHTHNCSPAHKISYSVRCKAKPELLTQAFLKFYEILHAFPVVPENEEILPSGEFRSLHLCEAPGAFIVALNHFLALHYPHMKWRWLGNTLNPHYEGTPSSECIADDRFILYTPHNWFFGRDETGNLMSRDYLFELRQCVGPEGVSLVTADGSIDCQGNPAEQENMTHRLHLCEVIAALSTLCKGGCLVLKKFTFFEVESVNLMFLLSCCFHDVIVHKPITSKAGNSEVYVIAIGFIPLRRAYLEELIEFFGKDLSKVTLFSKEQIPLSFIARIIDCCSFFKKIQADAIQRNISLYEANSESSMQYCALLKMVVHHTYLERNACQPIALSRRIVPHTLEWDKEIIPEALPTKFGGQIMKRSKLERLNFLKEQYSCLAHYYVSTYRDLSPEDLKLPFASREFSVEDEILNLLFVREGKCFHFAFVSRFCHVNLMQILVHTFKECVTETEWTKVQSEHFTNMGICAKEVYKRLVDSKSNFTMQEIAKMYPKATILDEGYYLSPHACHKTFEDLLTMISEKRIKEGTDIVVVNCPLLTRLQNGLLTITGVLFQKIVFHEPANIQDGISFFALVNFVSIEKGIALIERLNELGWTFGRERNSDKTLNQVLPLQVLIQSKLHPAICRYNSLYCLDHVNTLQNIQFENQ